MSTKMKDYLNQVTVDNNQTLTVRPRRILREGATKNQVIHVADDGSEERIELGTSGKSICYVTMEFPDLPLGTAATLWKFWNDASYGDGKAKSFKWQHTTEDDVYGVRFDSDVEKELERGQRGGIAQIRLKVLGYI